MTKKSNEPCTSNLIKVRELNWEAYMYFKYVLEWFETLESEFDTGHDLFYKIQ